jgi:RNA polymerase sigma-70 factor (ECF subfamily)
MNASLPNFPVNTTPLLRQMMAVKAEAVGCESTERPLSDERMLVAGLRRGEREALESLITTHQPMVRRLVSRLSGFENDADDLVQDVFVLALRHACKFDGRSSVSTWLTRIAINACRSHHRTRLFRAAFWKKRRDEAKEIESPDASISSERRESIQKVTHAMQRIGLAYREVIALHYLEDMTLDEIAALLGLTKSTVGVRLHRARKMLEELLGPAMRD